MTAAEIAQTPDGERAIAHVGAIRRLEVPRAATTDGNDLVVVDTRRSVEADTVEIAWLPAMALIPTGRGSSICAPSPRQPTWCERASCRKGATMAVLNGVPAAHGFGEDGLTAEARRALHAHRLPVACVLFGHQTEFAHALIEGRAVAAFEPFGKPPGNAARCSTR